MAKKSFPKISLLAIALFFALVFGVMDKGVAFAGKWGGEFFGSGTHSTDHSGPITGIFGTKTEANTEDSPQSIIVAFGVQAMSDDDDDDDDGDNDSDDDDGDDDDDDKKPVTTTTTNKPVTTTTTPGDSDDDDDDGTSSPTTPTNTPDDDDDDGDDDDNDSDDDDDDYVRSDNLVSSVRNGSLLKEVNENPELANGAAVRILRAGGARPLGFTPTSEEMSSTTQSSYTPGGRVSDPSYFLAERDANGDVQFTFKRKTGSTVSTLSTTDQDVSLRLADDLASGWKGVETHKDASNGIFNWDAYSDSQSNADENYLSLGSWLFIYKDPNDGSFTGSYALGVAAGGNDPFENNNLAGLTGTATYRGPATGLHMMKASDAADPVFDYFDARASLSVDFGDATALGTVSGTISGGRTDGGVALPTLTLGSADITGNALGGNFDADTSGVTGSGVALSGKWGGEVLRQPRRPHGSSGFGGGHLRGQHGGQPPEHRRRLRGRAHII